MTAENSSASNENAGSQIQSPHNDDYSFGLIVVLGLVLVVSFAIARGSNGVAAVAFLIFVIGSLVMYVAPALVAVLRRHPNTNSIIVLDLLLGWTFLGWVAALVWAYSAAPASEEALKAKGDAMRSCPFCAEPIRSAAIKCKHCGSDVSKAMP